MPVELVGQQIRIREENPDKFTEFRTQDIGSYGKLQRVAGYSGKTGWKTQSWRINLSDYQSEKEAIIELKKIRTSSKNKKEAEMLIKKWFR